MPKLIAETAWHHEGDLDFMRDLVDAIGTAGCADVLKMHVTLDLDEYMSREHELYPTLETMLFSERQWEALVERARSHGLGLMLLVNDTRAARFAARIGAELVEIHALCLGDPHLLDATREPLRAGAELVLGVGGSELEEIRWAMERIGEESVVLMFGFQNYPTRYERVNFARMRQIMDRFPGCRFGYADHCAWDEPNNELVTLLGAALGVAYVEKHVTTVPGEERLDFQAAISLDACQRLRERLDLLEACEGEGGLTMRPEESRYARPGTMKKVAVLERAVHRGDRLELGMVSFRRTATDGGLTGPEVEDVLGDKLDRSLEAGRTLLPEHLEGRKA